MLGELMPREPEVLGLLALMELQASRAATRTDADGNLVLLADQDRSRWDQARIARGLASLDRAGPMEGAGPYQLQAAIAACHARAVSSEATDWPRIVALYRALAEVAPSPVVELNRAVAMGLAHGPSGSPRSTRPTSRRCANIISCPPPAPIFSAGLADGRRRPSSTAGRSPSPTTRASGPSSRPGSRRARPAGSAGNNSLRRRRLVLVWPHAGCASPHPRS